MYEFLVAAYTKYLTKGINIKDISLRETTICFYLLAVNDMFVRRRFQPPFDPYSPGNKPAVLLKNYEKLEVIPNKRNPLTVEMIAAMSDYAEVSAPLSFHCAIFDWVVLGRYVGQSLSEFSQTNQKQTYCFEAPGRQKILKSFNGSDFTFFGPNKKEVTCKVPSPKSLQVVRIRWRIQKNRRNGEVIHLTRDDDIP